MIKYDLYDPLVPLLKMFLRNCASRNRARKCASGYVEPYNWAKSFKEDSVRKKGEVFAIPIDFLDSFKVDITRYSNIHLWMWQIHGFFWAIKLATLAWTNWIAWPNRYIHMRGSDMWFKLQSYGSKSCYACLDYLIPKVCCAYLQSFKNLNFWTTLNTTLNLHDPKTFI